MWPRSLVGCRSPRGAGRIRSRAPTARREAVSLLGPLGSQPPNGSGRELPPKVLRWGYKGSALHPHPSQFPAPEGPPDGPTQGRARGPLLAPGSRFLAGSRSRRQVAHGAAAGPGQELLLVKLPGWAQLPTPNRGGTPPRLPCPRVSLPGWRPRLLPTPCDAHLSEHPPGRWPANAPWRGLASGRQGDKASPGLTGHPLVWGAPTAPSSHSVCFSSTSSPPPLLPPGLTPPTRAPPP